MIELIPFKDKHIKEVESLLDQLLEDDTDDGVKQFLVKPKREAIELFLFKHSHGIMHDYFIEVNGLIVGILIVCQSTRWYVPWAWEVGIFIEKPYRNLGYGTRAIVEATKNLGRGFNESTKHLTLSPKQDNLKAIELYKRLGYKQAEFEPNELGLICMEKTI